MSTISQFPYNIGGGRQVNRVISFKEDENTISAKVYAVQKDAKPICISTLKDDQIFVDSTSAKEKKAIVEKTKHNWEVFKNLSFPGEKSINTYTLEQQKSILQNLGPNGSWSITIQNHLGKDPRYEKIVRLRIYKK